ncbi:MAG: Nif11-like leader peptide family RiPP precursor [Oscillospiraceae bacterium]|nr:Nif11-like leader peptide family RiPP precursor [Oscillospiraceae bacterium]
MTFADLIKKISEDKEFEERYKALDSIDAVMEQAAADGYTITEKDVEALRSEAEFSESGRAELSDDMLDEVAGGFIIGTLVSRSWMRQWILALFKGNKGSCAVQEDEGLKNPLISSPGISVTALPHSAANLPIVATLLNNTPSKPPEVGRI